MIEFASVIFFATFLKLSSSVDDAVWLAKLLDKETVAHRKIIQITYLLSLSFVTFLSFFLYLLGDRVLSYLSDTEEILPIVSSVILIIFSLTYLRNDHEESRCSTQKKETTLSDKIITAFVITFIGSIDELLLFITVLGTGKFTIFPLFLGTIIAAFIIIILVEGISKAESIMNFLQKVPIWLVIFIVGLITLILSLYSLLR